MGGLCSFEAHEDYVEALLAEYHRSPPHGFSKVTLAQLERADKEVFQSLAQSLRGELRPDADGDLPLTKKLKETLEKPAVQLLLTPLPGRPVDAKPPKGATQQKQGKRSRSPSAPRRSNKQRRKQNKKGSPRAGPPMPTGLQGKAHQDDKGVRICYGYNLGTCKQSEVPAGQSCARGRHVCATPGCFGLHPTSKCTR
jgi:hypothetical protein